MKVASLSAVVAVLESGKRPKGGVSADSGTIPSLGGEHLNRNGGINLDKLKYVDEAFFNSMKKGVIKENDILIVKDGATTGKVGFVDSDFPFKRAAINEHLFCLRVNTEKASPKYVFLFLKSLQGQQQILKDFRGAAIGGISRGFIELTKIPLPPLDDQIRIAHLLSKVEGLIAQRKQHLQQLDDLLKSVFLEMFGDPVRNEKKWDTSELEKLCEVVVDCPHSTPVYSDEETGYYCVRSSDLVDGYLILSKTLQVREDVYEERIKRYTPQVGDIVYSREGGRLGNAARILGDESICLGQRIMLFRAIGENTVDFLWALLESRSFKTKVQGLVGGGAAPRINIKDLKKILVIEPSNDMRTQFSRITKSIDQIKSYYQQSLADLENLYGALSQQAFKGELDLSRIPLNTNGAPTQKTSKPFSQGFARQLLAAEILHRHHQHKMTQMKLQKLIHLAEHHAQLDEVQGDYQRQAAGPYDNRIMYGINSGLEKQQWFKTVGRGQNATYSPLVKTGSHKKYLSHWQNRMQKIDELLSLLGTAKPQQCEIVSTLYAAWNDLLIDNEQVTDERIIAEASSPERWHQEKAKIEPDKWPAALEWMRAKNLVPTGYGKHTRKLI